MSEDTMSAEQASSGQRGIQPSTQDRSVRLPMQLAAEGAFADQNTPFSSSKEPVIPNQYDARIGGGQTAGRPPTGGVPPLETPGQGQEPHGHGLRNTVIGGGVVGTVGGMVTAAALLLSGGGSKQPEHSPTTTSNGGVPTLIIPTPTETPMATATVEKTPDPNKIFMPGYRKLDVGGSTFLLDPQIETVSECPSPTDFTAKAKCEQLHEIIPNTDEFPALKELKKEADDKILMTAWLKLEKGMTDADIAANMGQLLQEYRANKGKTDHSFTVYGFGEKDDYATETAIKVDDSYSIEPVMVALPNKYTPIELISSFKGGFVVDSSSKTLYFVMYDFTRGGVNQVSPHSDRSKYGLASGYSQMGTLLSNRAAQTNNKITLDQINIMTPILLNFQNSLIPYKTSKDWHSIWSVK